MEQGAHMALFAGYEMPLWYPAGVKREHLAVLTGAGMFDTSHMAVVTVQGNDALALLQFCFTKDLTACMGRGRKPLIPGRSAYGVFLNEGGHVIDDAIISHVSPGSYMIVVNAGMGWEIARHLQEHAGDTDVHINDLTGRVGKMDIQGPLSARILAKIIKNPQKVFDRMPYFSFKGFFDESFFPEETVSLLNGVPVMLSRTGYTGEFGFELFMDAAHIESAWTAALEAGHKSGLTFCGLAARDSLRTGAILPLSHQDIGPWPFRNNPWNFALSTADANTFTKRFIGDRALENDKNFQYTYPFVGFDLRKISSGGSTTVTDTSGTPIGTVLTCVTDMGIDRVGERIYSIASPDKPAGFRPRGLSCGFVKTTKKLTPGDVIHLQDDRRSIRVLITDDIRPDRTARRALKDML